jgi:putative oxidoreductase
MGGGMTSINIGELISIPMPFDINALFLAGSIELIGGFLILIGLWVHIAAIVAAFNMLMAYLIAHLAWFPTLNNGELAAMYFFSFLIIFCMEPGSISVDSWLRSRKESSA